MEELDSTITKSDSPNACLIAGEDGISDDHVSDDAASIIEVKNPRVVKINSVPEHIRYHDDASDCDLFDDASDCDLVEVAPTHPKNAARIAADLALLPKSATERDEI